MFTTTERALGEVAVPMSASATGPAAAPADVPADVPAQPSTADRLGRLQDAVLAATTPAPCAARPSTGFTHADGTCRCFMGGPAPEFPDGTVRPVYRFAS